VQANGSSHDGALAAREAEDAEACSSRRFGREPSHIAKSRWYPRLYGHWDSTFQCDRCELRYVPAA